MLDENAVADAIFAHVETYVERATAPLLARAEKLESEVEVLRAERDVEIARAGQKLVAEHDADIKRLEAAWEARLAAIEAHYVDEQTSSLRSEVAELRALVQAIPEPIELAAEPAEIPDVQRMVDEAVARVPAAKDGKDADPELIRALVAEAVAEIPRPEPLPAPTLTDLAPMVDEAIQRAVSSLPTAKDGVSLAGALIDRDGNLVVTLSDGSTRELGPVVGKDGAPGIDGKAGEQGPPGFNLDDFDITRPDERTMILAFTRGDRTDTYEIGLSAFVDRGVFKDGQEYETGDGVTWGGSYWMAQEKTTERPGEGSTAWRLAVKRGANGKDADAAPLLRLIEQKFSDEEDRLIKRLEAFLRSKGLL